MIAGHDIPFEESQSMFNEEPLLQQIEEATRCQSARYLVTAIVDGAELEAGETVIRLHSDVIKCSQTINQLVASSLQRKGVAVDRWKSVRIVIEEAPLLY